MGFPCSHILYQVSEQSAGTQQHQQYGAEKNGFKMFVCCALCMQLSNMRCGQFKKKMERKFDSELMHFGTVKHKS